VFHVDLGNGKAVGRATEHLVPLMSAGYMLLSLYVIATYIAYIPQVFADIWRDAFSSKAIGGGCAGISIHSAMRQGISRGIFSNEAGLGSAAIAHASSERESAAEEGLFSPDTGPRAVRGRAGEKAEDAEADLYPEALLI